jgi:hypothetical protein
VGELAQAEVIGSSGTTLYLDLDKEILYAATVQGEPTQREINDNLSAFHPHYQ